MVNSCSLFLRVRRHRQIFCGYSKGIVIHIMGLVFLVLASVLLGLSNKAFAFGNRNTDVSKVFSESFDHKREQHLNARLGLRKRAPPKDGRKRGRASDDTSKRSPSPSDQSQSTKRQRKRTGTLSPGEQSPGSPAQGSGALQNSPQAGQGVFIAQGGVRVSSPAPQAPAMQGNSGFQPQYSELLRHIRAW